MAISLVAVNQDVQSVMKCISHMGTWKLAAYLIVQHVVWRVWISIRLSVSQRLMRGTWRREILPICLRCWLCSFNFHSTVLW